MTTDTITRPLILVAVRWAWLGVDVDALTGAVAVRQRGSGFGTADLAAVEHGLRIAEAWEGRVVVVSHAPPAADEALRDLLAVGVARAIRVEAEPIEAADLAASGLATARSIVEATREVVGAPDLVLCGDRSVDRGIGAVPAFLAAELAAAQALGVVRLEPRQDNGVRHLLAHRRLDGGRREVLRVPLPAVVSTEPAGVSVRRAGLRQVLATRHAEITTVTARPTAARELPVDRIRSYRPRPRALPAPPGPDSHHRLLALTGALQERTPPRILTPSSPADAARELLDFLRQHDYLSVEGSAPTAAPSSVPSSGPTTAPTSEPPAETEEPAENSETGPTPVQSDPVGERS